ncbi:MAG: cobyric acid synthase [Methanosarcinaceae archaeon]|jgi:adenosylcobyric acid synthase|nr:cobyric acid synthase [Methanosarcinaceae archaeon]
MKNKKNKKQVLVLGTSSHVGKSAIVTALCYILSKKYSVAPFKAQNMSLNSWITKEGHEIGIAQAIQAKAAGIEPTVDMNPVLLKPKGDKTSQIVLMGKPYADKTAGEYYESVNDIYGILKAALDRLWDEYEIIVMEGAGGAAEINLYNRDIVNIGTQRLTDANIILVGDIERGGVFASLYGTVELLPCDVRKKVKGFIINKFRGDIKILESGLSELEDKTNIPVLGVIPYFNVRIPSEDSVSIKDKKNAIHLNDVEIVIIRFPHISNFTDFEPLESLAKIRYIEFDEEIGTPDAIILPGTKNTIEDLYKLNESGLSEKIKKFHNNIPIIGICGGYQMLGKEIIDVNNIEGYEIDRIEGLGLLNVTTTFDKYEKTTKQVTKKIIGKSPIFKSIIGEKIKGYEIHMGNTCETQRFSKTDIFVKNTCENSIFEDDGCVDENGLVIGTYLHGLFENENIRHTFVKYLCEKKGIEYKSDDVYFNENAYEALGNMVETAIDMDKVYEIIGI